MKFSFLKILAVSAIALGLLIMAMPWGGGGRSPISKEGGTLSLFCAAGLQYPVEEIAKQYEEEFGVKVEPQYMGSGRLLSAIRGGDYGDLYLSADHSYVDQGRELNLLDEELQIAWQRAVLVVHKENPHGIESLQDVLTNLEDLRIVLPNPEVTAIGRVAHEQLVDSGDWDRLWESKLTVRETVNMVATDVSTKIADVGIVWDATAAQDEDLLAIPIPELAGARSKISVAVIRRTEQPTLALHFARYMTAADRGLPVFEKHAYDVIDNGDKWADEPEIVVFAGGLNRLAVEGIVSEFAIREGVSVLATYTGCGLLVTKMNSGIKPDVYFACDSSYMEKVQDRFYDAVDVSATAMVIIVPTGNPHDIHELSDLAQEDLKVGITNPDHSALGDLSRQLLEKNNLWESVSPNFRDLPPTADILVTQVALGALDVAIVYRANTTQRVEDLDVIEIDDPTAFAVQPIAIGRDSKHKHLTQRLVARIRAAQSKQLFEELDFRWISDPSILIHLNDNP